MADASRDPSRNVQSVSKGCAGNCSIENRLERPRAQGKTGDVEEADGLPGPSLGDLGGFHRTSGVTLVSTDLIPREKKPYL